MSCTQRLLFQIFISFYVSHFMRTMMTPLLLTPPMAEPVTLAEAKMYLKIDFNDDDDLIQTLISAARLMIEAASGHMLIEIGRAHV